jgi:hypothetical protein
VTIRIERPVSKCTAGWLYILKSYPISLHILLYVANLMSQEQHATEIHIYNYASSYTYEGWSLTLWEEHKFQELDSKVLRKIFGLIRDKLYILVYFTVTNFVF